MYATITIRTSIEKRLPVIRLVCPIASKVEWWLHANGFADDNWWHRDCVRCTSCNALWNDVPRKFYQLKTLNCSSCLPECCLCGIKSSMYPVFENEPVICGNCMTDNTPCEICGDKIWNRGFLCFFEGNTCFHYRNLLIQRAPHLVEFFDSTDRSFIETSHEGTPAISAIDKLLRPWLTEESLRRFNSLSGISYPKTRGRGKSNVKEDVWSAVAMTDIKAKQQKTYRMLSMK